MLAVAEGAAAHRRGRLLVVLAGRQEWGRVAGLDIGGQSSAGAGLLVVLALVVGGGLVGGAVAEGAS